MTRYPKTDPRTIEWGPGWHVDPQGTGSEPGTVEADVALIVREGDSPSPLTVATLELAGSLPVDRHGPSLTPTHQFAGIELTIEDVERLALQLADIARRHRAAEGS